MNAIPTECGCGQMHEPLLPIATACARAAACVSPVTATETVPLGRASGRLLAVEIAARFDMPRFDQSAMDGYAVASTGVLEGENLLPVSQRILAGQWGAPLQPGTAARIFTGAPLPEGADAVVMQEQAKAEGGSVTFRGPVAAGAHVRRRGEDMKEGEPLLRKGTALTARHLALLAAQGMAEVEVLRRPIVAVLSTGSELRGAGEDLVPGTLYDSNRPMLLALAEEMGLAVIGGGCLPDNVELLAKLHDLSDWVVTMPPSP